MESVAVNPSLKLNSGPFTKDLMFILEKGITHVKRVLLAVRLLHGAIAIAHNNAGLIEDSKAALMSRTAEREQQSQSHIPRFANQSAR